MNRLLSKISVSNWLGDLPLDEEKEYLDFKELYKNIVPILVFHAGKYVDKSVAEDLVQDVFLRAWQKRIPLFLKDNLKAYLYRSVQHACLDYLKHEIVEGDYIRLITNRLKIEEINYYSDDQSLYEQDERLIRIYEELEKLPPKCREIFVLSYLEERKTEDIANLLNLSKRTVEAQLYKALKMLRAALLMASVVLHSHFVF